MRIIPGLALVLALVAWAAPAAAGDDLSAIAAQARRLKETPAPPDIRVITDQARRLKETPAPPDVRTITDHAAAIRTGDRAEAAVEWLRRKAAPAQAAESAGQGSQRRVEILASWSLGSTALKNLFDQVAGRQDVVIVFRGVAAGETLGEGIKRLHSLLRDHDPLPNVQIDPMAFRRVAATSVPTLVLVEGDRPVATVRGIVSPAFIEEQVAGGRSGDLGVHGPTADIAEPDLLEVVQAKVQNFDLGAYQRRALEGYWKSARFQELPAATDRRVRTLDPTVVVTQPIKDAEGRVLVAAGSRINPLDQLPFTQRLVVFDGTDPKQVDVAARLAAEVNGARRVTLITTRIDRDDGWEHFKRVQDRLDAPVYLLTPDVASRFRLERVPAMVEAAGRVFVITEFPPEK